MYICFDIIFQVENCYFIMRRPFSGWVTGTVMTLCSVILQHSRYSNIFLVKNVCSFLFYIQQKHRGYLSKVTYATQRCLHTVPKAKRWRSFKAVWNGFFGFTGMKRRESAKLLHFPALGTEKSISCGLNQCQLSAFVTCTLYTLYLDQRVVEQIENSGQLA